MYYYYETMEEMFVGQVKAFMKNRGQDYDRLSVYLLLNFLILELDKK